MKNKIYNLEDWLKDSILIKQLVSLGAEPIDIEDLDSKNLFTANILGEQVTFRIFDFDTIGVYEYTPPRTFHDRKMIESNMRKMLTLSMFAKFKKMGVPLPDGAEVMAEYIQCCIETSNGDVILLPLEPYSLASVLMARDIDPDGFNKAMMDLTSRSVIEDIFGTSDNK